MGMGNAPVLILREGTKREKGKDAQFNNITAAKTIADAVRSSLGPRGMDKMLVDSLGDVVITNDGVTILKELDVTHPAAKMVIEVAKTQDNECGDGTTTSVILSGELLKQSEELINANVHPTIITNGYNMAAAKAAEILDDISVDATDDKMLRLVADTSLTGKDVGDAADQEMLSKLVVEAVKTVAEDGRVDTDNIRMTKKIGGVIGDTTLMKGLIIDKELVHSRMPAQVKNAKIALFNCGLEVKKTEIDAQIQINDAARMNDFLAEEEAGMKKLVDHIKSCGATVVFTTKAMDELIQHYLTKAGIMGFRRLKESDIMALAKATGGTVVSDVKDLVPENLGTAGLVEEKKVGDDNMCFVTECPNAKAVTMFIRGGTEHVIEEVERALNDAIRTVGITLEDGKVCAGAGAPEIELETRLLKYAATVGGREQLAIEKFAKAMECIPWTLAENAGLDPIDVIIKLKAAHENKKNGKYFGVSLEDGEPFDALKAKVIEPLRVKKQAVSSAAEVANMILRIDDVIAARQAPPGAGAGPGAGMPPADD